MPFGSAIDNLFQHIEPVGQLSFVVIIHDFPFLSDETPICNAYADLFE